MAGVMLITIMTIPKIPNLHSNNDSGGNNSSSSSSSSSNVVKIDFYNISVENIAAFPYQKILLLTLLDNCNKSSNICTYTDAPYITTAITALQRNSRSKINIRTSNNQQPCVSERLRQECNIIVKGKLKSLERCEREQPSSTNILSPLIPTAKLLLGSPLGRDSL
uniref:Uncharacterized protein n=1 Tax=Glossina austeni TaxID=7395 RepID=A0A1A9UP32_GLOAU